MVMILAGKVALITGAARGIGAASARLIGGEGAHVVVADRREDEAKAVVAELNAARPGSALFVSLDVTDEAEWQAAIHTAETAFGPIDVLVNNAGIIRVAPIEQMTLENFRKVIELDENYAEAYFNLGLLLADEGQNVEAERLLRRATELAPNSSHAVPRHNSIRTG